MNSGEWSQDQILGKVSQINLDYASASPQTLAALHRDCATQGWPDAVLIGVLEAGPRTGAIAAFCQGTLEKREREREASIVQKHRQETKDALAAIKSATEAGPEPHWSTVPMFWVAVGALIFAAIAAWPVIRDWLK